MTTNNLKKVSNFKDTQSVYKEYKQEIKTLDGAIFQTLQVVNSCNDSKNKKSFAFSFDFAKKCLKENRQIVCEKMVRVNKQGVPTYSVYRLLIFISSCYDKQINYGLKQEKEVTVYYIL